MTSIALLREMSQTESLKKKHVAIIWLVVWLPSIWHFPINIGLGIIIPIDEVIFFRGVAQTTNQYILIVWDIYFGGSSHIYIYLLIWNDLEFPEGYLNDIYYEKY